MKNNTDDIDVAKIDISIDMLNKYVKETSIQPFISVLEALKQDPNNELLLTQLNDTWASLGITQGAVLTYAPYISVLLSEDLFADN